MKHPQAPEIFQKPIETIDLTGLQLLSIMHVGIRLFDPNADTGTGLDREYEMAMAMRGKA